MVLPTVIETRITRTERCFAGIFEPIVTAHQTNKTWVRRPETERYLEGDPTVGSLIVGTQGCRIDEEKGNGTVKMMKATVRTKGNQ